MLSGSPSWAMRCIWWMRSCAWSRRPSAGARPPGTRWRRAALGDARSARHRRRERGRRPPARSAVSPHRSRRQGAGAQRGGAGAEAGRQAVRRRDLTPCLRVGRTRARSVGRSEVRAHRRAGPSRRTASQSHRPHGLLHHGLLPPPRGAGCRGRGRGAGAGRRVRARGSGMDPARYRGEDGRIPRAVPACCKWPACWRRSHPSSAPALTCWR